MIAVLLREHLGAWPGSFWPIRLPGASASVALVDAWFRSLPGLNCMTPDQLVRRGKAAHVHAYLDQVIAGGYA